MSAPIPGIVSPRAAVSACVFRGREVLLVKRGKPPFAGAWSLPGGSIEASETAQAAIVREIAEETGLDISVGEVVGVNDVIVHDRQDGALLHHYVIVVFAATVPPNVAEPTAGSDAAEARFFKLDAPEVGQLGRRVRRLVDRAFELTHMA
ncbi:MAG: NUDIX hydrolase [Hyphomicrobium aestuarii]|nr:NUDIX hydrolase [Hyphomicrobium aestuarii]